MTFQLQIFIYEDFLSLSSFIFILHVHNFFSILLNFFIVIHYFFRQSVYRCKITVTIQCVHLGLHMGMRACLRASQETPA